METEGNDFVVFFFRMGLSLSINKPYLDIINKPYLDNNLKLLEGPNTEVIWVVQFFYISNFLGGRF